FVYKATQTTVGAYPEHAGTVLIKSRHVIVRQTVFGRVDIELRVFIPRQSTQASEPERTVADLKYGLREERTNYIVAAEGLELTVFTNTDPGARRDPETSLGILIERTDRSVRRPIVDCHPTEHVIFQSVQAARPCANPKISFPVF